MRFQELAEFFVNVKDLRDDLDEVLKLLCLKTLNEYEIEGMIFLTLESRGILKPRSAFGVDLQELNMLDHEFPLRELSPCSEAIKDQKLVFIENFQAEKANFKGTCLASLPPHINSVVAFPVNEGARAIGALLGISPSKKMKSPQLVDILQAIATTIGALLNEESRRRHFPPNHNGEVRMNRKSEITEYSGLSTPSNFELTERQNLILQMIADGRTNADIADLLGYSESLIRQETIRIYSKLACSGRNEAAAIYRSTLAGASKNAS